MYINIITVHTFLSRLSLTCSLPTHWWNMKEFFILSIDCFIYTEKKKNWYSIYIHNHVSLSLLLCIFSTKKSKLKKMNFSFRYTNFLSLSKKSYVAYENDQKSNCMQQCDMKTIFFLSKRIAHGRSHLFFDKMLVYVISMIAIVIYETWLN